MARIELLECDAVSLVERRLRRYPNNDLRDWATTEAAVPESGEARVSVLGLN